jgi:integrase
VREREDEFNQLGPTKSEAGERTIPVGPFVVNALKAQRLATIFELVFPTPSTGAVQTLSNIRRGGQIPAMIRAGILDKDGNAKYSGFHCLRHFYASWCINRKEDGGLGLTPKLVQERLGHSTLAMTMDVYGQLFPSDDDPRELEEVERTLHGLVG